MMNETFFYTFCEAFAQHMRDNGLSWDDMGVSFVEDTDSMSVGMVMILLIKQLAKRHHNAEFSNQDAIETVPYLAQIPGDSSLDKLKIAIKMKILADQ